jgi:uncharacterized protein (TIGR00369 family)
MENFKELLKTVVEQVIPFHGFLGMELVDIRNGFAKIKIPYRAELIGDPRSMALHGGIISTAMDSVGGAAAMTTLISPEDKLSTIDMRIDYLRPGKAQDLFAEGEIIRSGNRIIVTRMIAYQDDISNLVADGKGVYNVQRKKDKPN